jgi:predicted permease
MLRRAARACYRATLIAYPPRFRAQFGAAMAADFAERIADRSKTGGASAALWMAIRGLANSAANGIAERMAIRSRPVGLRNVLSDLASDVAFTARTIVRRPALAIWSVLTLALGLSATIVIYAVVDASLLRPIDLPNPKALVALMETANGEPSSVSFENFDDWRARATTVHSLAVMRAQSVNLTGLDTPDRVRGGFVSSGFFDLVGVSPALGRRFTVDDDKPAADPVVVLSHELWRDRFGKDPAIIGRVVVLNNVPFTVTGVMPDGFYFPVDYAQAWLPARFHTGNNGRGNRSWLAFGRLADDASMESARAEFAAIASALASEYPAQNQNRGARVEKLQKWITADMGAQLASVFALVVLLLAAACVNVSSLQIGAGAVRRREMAVRSALGAGRARLVRQVFAENLLLALAGSVLGLFIASLVVPVVVASAPVEIFGLDRAAVDWRVTMFAFVIAVAAGLVSGLLPAIHWSRRAAVDALPNGGRTTSDRRAGRIRAGLVVGQTATAVLLLASGILLVNNYRALAITTPGFDADRRWSLEYRLPANKYKTPAAQAQFHEDVAARVAAVPGVRRAAVVRALPFSGNGDTVSYHLPGALPSDAPRVSEFNTITDNYFSVMGIPLKQGRTFDSRDSADAPLRVVVSERFAKVNWPDGNVIGKRFRVVGRPLEPEVIGVVGDVRHRDLASDLRPAVYARNMQNPALFMTLVAETDGDPAIMREGIRSAVWSVDSQQPVWKERSLRSLVDTSVRPELFFSSSAMIVSMSALVLVMGGLYGVVAQSVIQRRREIGLRIALGATKRAVMWQVQRQGLMLALAGIVIGVPAAMAAASALGRLVTIVEPARTAPLAMTAVILSAITIAACYLPARRAMNVDPASVLRE